MSGGSDYRPSKDDGLPARVFVGFREARRPGEAHSNFQRRTEEDVARPGGRARRPCAAAMWAPTLVRIHVGRYKSA
jgi:hypothetical protein